LIVLLKKKQMKKLVFMFVAVAAMSFASCGNKAEAPVEDVDTTAVDSAAVDSAATDSAAVDSAATDSAAVEAE
jgi:predicted small secreted protein